MKSQTYAIVTPSFSGDFERCKLLVETVARYVAGHVNHYIVVDRRDVELFQPLTNARTRLLVVEDILPRWVFRIPGVPKVWFSLATRPVRNWILQQIVKLSVAEHLVEDVMLFADSDTFFCQPFDPHDMERDGKVALLRETGQRGLIDNNDRWHQVAAGLLGVPAEETYDTNFISNVVCWRRDHALALKAHVEARHGKSLTRVLASQTAFSEYILYGLFVTHVLGENGKHWYEPRHRTVSHWQEVPLDEAGVLALKSEIDDYTHSIMISAKSRTPMAVIRKIFG